MESTYLNSATHSFESAADSGRKGVKAMQTMNEETIEMVSSEVRRALDLLHGNGLVFGDLRPPNVMINKLNGKLIDFNWPGEEGQAKYPSLMSQGIAWP